MRGDPPATRTEDLWRGFSDRLRRFLRARLPDDATTDDVLQEVFLKVHANIHTLRDDDRVRSWLYRIARHAIADHFRAGRGGVRGDMAEALEVASRGSPDDAEQQLATALRDMVDDLPPRYRDAVVMTEIDGLTQAEMARRLGISLSGGKSRVQRGREKLKALLLDCCHVELDRHGKVVAYEKRSCCVTDGGPAPRPRRDV